VDRYDVVVAVDGKKVERGVEVFSKLVQAKRAGETLNLTLYRGGQKLDVAVTLAGAPEQVDEGTLKYEDDPDIAQRRSFGLRGKILRPGPDGWILDDLGELPEFPDFEGLFNRHSQEVGPDGVEEDVQESRRVDPQGETIHVRKNGDGSVEVRRYKSGTPEDQVDAKTYASLDELRSADPEAADMLKSPTTMPADRVYDHLRHQTELLKKQKDSFRQYQDALRDYMKRYEGRLAPGRPAPLNVPQWHEWREGLVPRSPGMPAVPQPPLPPMQAQPVPEAKFELRPDGSISVDVEDGATKLHMDFSDARAFENTAPRLYERYRDTLDRAK
jgi:hypothetical protein